MRKLGVMSDEQKQVKKSFEYDFVFDEELREQFAWLEEPIIQIVERFENVDLGET